MTLKNLYAIIDVENFSVLEKYENKVIKLFKEFINERIDGEITNEMTLAQLEIDIQNFVINNNTLSPILKNVYTNGEVYEYPSLSKWTNIEFDYLIKRQSETKNPFLIIKYSHILWLSTKKHFQFATDAINEYYKIVKNQKSNIKLSYTREEFYNFNHNISNIFYLAISTGKQIEIEKIKKLVVLNANSITKTEKILNIGLIKLMLTNPKNFKIEHFKNLDKKLLNYASRQNDTQNRIDILKIGEQVSKKIGVPTILFKETIAKSYTELSYQREGGNNFASLKFCQDSLKLYKQTKNTIKIKELEKRYKILKQNSVYESFDFKIDIDASIKNSKTIALRILNEKPESILNFLMYSKIIFPPYEYLLETAENEISRNGLESLIGTELTDEFGHTCSHYSEYEEKIHFSIMESFDFGIKTSSQFILEEIILGGIKKDKITTLFFLNFLQQNSWLGQNISIKYKQNSVRTFNWLNTLAPAINDFFSQFYFYFQNPKNIPNFILTVDSLCLKIEGILRDMCELRGESTFFQTEDSKKRIITKEKDINTLLREDPIKNILSKDDLILLQFLLIDKAGWNLRNRVAHSLIRDINDYSINYVFLLLIVILKLAKNEYAPPKAV